MDQCHARRLGETTRSTRWLDGYDRFHSRSIDRIHTLIDHGELASKLEWMDLNQLKAELLLLRRRDQWLGIVLDQEPIVNIALAVDGECLGTTVARVLNEIDFECYNEFSKHKRVNERVCDWRTAREFMMITA